MSRNTREHQINAAGERSDRGHIRSEIVRYEFATRERFRTTDQRLPDGRTKLLVDISGRSLEPGAVLLVLGTVSSAKVVPELNLRAWRSMGQGNAATPDVLFFLPSKGARC